MKRCVITSKMLNAIMLVLLLSVAGLTKLHASYSFSAVCETGQTLYYSITDAENHYVSVVYPGDFNHNPWPYGFTMPSGEMVIPEYVTNNNGVNWQVTSIGDYVFYYCSGLTSLTIGNSVTSIGNNAFSGCSGLTSLTIGNSVTSIGNYAFSGCSRLASLSIGNSVTNIGNYAFSSCYGLTILTIPNSVTSIGNYAFSGCRGLTSLTIGNSVTNIGNNAFWGCDELTSLTIGNSVTSIGNQAFWGCDGLTSLNIPNSVTNIGDGAFSFCDGLTSLTIPNSVTNIGNSAFSNCEGLTTVTIGDLETSMVSSEMVIGNYAFSGCSGLTSLTIGNSVTSIGTYAFSYCHGLTSLILGNSLTSIGDNAFLECDGLTSLTIPNSVINIGNSAFSYCEELTTVTIGNSVTNIGAYAFDSCNGLTSVYYNGDIGQWCNITFGDMTSNPLYYANKLYINNQLVTNIVIPENVSEIKDYAFYRCGGFKSLTIGNSVTSIGDFAFCDCMGLTSLMIGDSVTSIGDWAFCDCIDLTSLMIGGSVTSIGDGTFSGCRNITDMMVLPETPPIVDYNFSYSFSEVPENCMVYIPFGSLDAYQNASGWNGFTNYYEMESSSSEINLTVNPIAGGAVTGGGVYDNGEVCTVMAVPNPGFLFVNWTEYGSLVSTNANYTFDVTRYRNLVANFVLENVGPEQIVFADANVKAVCVANWDTNGDGELSYDEAAAVTVLGDVFQDNYIITSFNELQYFTGITALGYHSFYGCTKLTSIKIPDSVTSIEYGAFEYCSGLIGALIIPNSVTAIGGYAFSGCSGLTSLTIGNSVTTIGESAFSGCNGLTSLTIPDSVISIGVWAFSGCEGLTTVTIGDPVTSMESSEMIIGGGAFYWCSGLTSLTIGNSVTSIGDIAFCNCSGLTSLTIPNSVTSIGDGAFEYCSGLTGSLTIPNSVTTIGESAFYGCSNLTSVTVPCSVTSIGNRVFGYCVELGQIIVDPDNTVYDSRENCNAIIQTNENKLVAGCKNSFIPNTVALIGDGAFDGCRGLTSLTIGNSVMNIGNWAFRDCNSLTNMIILAETPPALGNNSFYNVAKNIPIHIPCGSLEAYQAASGWNEFTNYIEICSGTINVTVDLEEGGSVTGYDYYEGGTVCTLTATANDGYSFLYWTEDGEIVSNDAVYSFIVIGDRSLVAHFIDGDLCAVTFDLYDSYGDGYTGNYLVVNLQDGICQKLTVASGSFASYTLYVGGHIVLGWITGSYSSECSFMVSYEDGTVIYEGSNLNSDFSYEFDVDCGGGYVQTINLVAGTNWFSANVEITLNDLKAALVAASPNSAITIKSQTQKATYNPSNGRWTGRLTTFDLSQMYKITVSSACEITLEGVRINPAEHPVTITPGANWIAYPLNTSKTPQEVFTGFAVPGDMVKSQSQKKQYNSNGRWTGQLGSLEPGKGYIYTSSATEDRVFTFPTF